MKAALIIDMPTKCFKCPVVDMQLHLCPMLDQAIMPETKPYNCPLIPLDLAEPKLTPESKKSLDEQRNFFNKYFADNSEHFISPNYDEIFDWLSIIPDGTIISRNGGVGMSVSTLKDIIKNGKAYYILESELKDE